MKNIIKVGLIGPGRGKNGFGIGHYIAREILNYDYSKLVSILGRDKKRTESSISIINNMVPKANRFNGRIYISKNSHEFFRNDNIELVIICSPLETHYDYIIKCLENKKNVLVEKPIIGFMKNQSELKRNLLKELFNMANGLNLFISTNCQRAAIVYSLKEYFGISFHPQNIIIELSIPYKGNLLNEYQLFELLVAHPISILIKYGLFDAEKVSVTQFVADKKYQNSLKVEISGFYQNDLSVLVDFQIILRQSHNLSLTTMKLNIDQSSFIIKPVKCNNNEYRVIIQDHNFTELEIDDMLKTSVISAIEATKQNDQKRLLINNIESQLIYLVQEHIRNNINFN